MNQHLVLLDFDGTLANTFEPSPNGWDVESASGYAISQVFGREGTRVFEERGGLLSNEPGELVAAIAAKVGSGDSALAELTQRFVNAKLELLMEEISPQWPELYPGVKGFVGAVSEGRLPVDIGILSSGHDNAIRKVFEVNGLDAPRILVTSYLLRERNKPKLHKPHPYQMAEAHRRWLVQRSILPRFDGFPNGEQYMGRSLGKPNMLYVGDDPVRDGGLAAAGRIPFVFVPFTKPGFIPDPEKGQIGVANFNELLVRLDYNRIALLEEESFAQVLFNRTDNELFPPLSEEQMPYARIVQENTGRFAERR